MGSLDRRGSVADGSLMMLGLIQDEMMGLFADIASSGARSKVQPLFNGATDFIAASLNPYNSKG